MDQITLALAKNYTDEQIRKSSTGEMLIDKTLSKEGYAADAKAVGDAISQINPQDGISPTVAITDIDGGHRVTITDKDGAKTVDVMDGKDGYTPIKGVDYFDGKDGADGFSPSVMVIPNENTGDVIVNVQDALGHKSAIIPKGADGKDGITPHIGDNGNWFIGETDTGKSSRGIDGKNGQDGQDGYTPQKGIDYFDGEPGNSGVYVGTEPPTDPDVQVWIDPDDDEVMAFLPQTTEAKVGQYLKISKVDADGRVIAVRAVDAIGGGNVDCVLPVDFSGVTVHSVNHRGYSSVAPENTIPAYIMSKEKGFVCVEADVAFTSDGVAVLLHDSTIDRTSNGSGSISALTFSEVSKYDFGSWKSATYTGTRIPTFAEFIAFCKNVGLHPYIELKNAATYTAAQIQSLVAMVNNCGMRGKVSWISFTPTYLGYVRDADPTARLGYLVESINSTAISTAKTLQTGRNEVFMDSSDYDADAIARCQAAGLPLEIWTINSKSTIENMDSYITGVTSDNQIAENILREKAMNYEYGIDEETEKTLTSISATYSGGNVAVGTAVTALTGILVTAYYSDGTTVPVTGYTLSGTIAEGANTVTVSYGGKTTTFSVVGVAESGGNGGGETDNTGKWVDGKFYFNLTQGGISHIASSGYLDTGRANRVSYAGFDCTLTPGARYRLIGVTGVRYGVQTVTEVGYAKIQSGSDLEATQGTGSVADKLDSGWQSSGYEFVADSEAVCAWITASFSSDNITTPEQAMPVYLEEVEQEEDIPAAVVNLAFANEAENVIPNIGTGGEQYNATVIDYNGSHESSGDGLVLNNHAYANVNYLEQRTESAASR